MKTQMDTSTGSEGSVLALMCITSAEWSLYRRVLEDGHFTNNSIESFNSNFNRSMTGRNIWRVLKAFQREEHLASQRSLQIVRGDLIEANPGRRQTMEQRYDNIKQIVSNYNLEMVDDYFKALLMKV